MYIIYQLYWWHCSAGASQKSTGRTQPQSCTGLIMSPSLTRRALFSRSDSPVLHLHISESKFEDDNFRCHTGRFVLSSNFENLSRKYVDYSSQSEGLLLEMIVTMVRDDGDGGYDNPVQDHMSDQYSPPDAPLNAPVDPGQQNTTCCICIFTNCHQEFVVLSIQPL